MYHRACSPSNPDCPTTGTGLNLPVLLGVLLLAFSGEAVAIDTELVQTLILTSSSRMESQMGLTPPEVDGLMVNLTDLANHPSVEGVIVDLDLDIYTDLATLYAVWDADVEDFRTSVTTSPRPDLANNVLFGCHAPLPDGCDGELEGIHDILLNLLTIYPNVSYLILVGDDRILPMARILDFTVFPESEYTLEIPPGLTPDATTVGQAIGMDRYLSDDPLAVNGPVHPEDLRQSGSVLLPDLAVGRLASRDRTGDRLDHRHLPPLGRIPRSDEPLSRSQGPDHRLLLPP